MISLHKNHTLQTSIASWLNWSNKISSTYILSYLFLMATLTMIFLPPSSMVAARLGPHHPRSPVSSIQSTHSHSHHVPRKSEDGEIAKITADRELLQDKEHVKEDMGEWVFADGKEPTPEEMEFHYFKMHDFDNNSQLDGLEILQALYHVLPLQDEQPEQNSMNSKQAEGSGKNSQNYAVNYESNKKHILSDEDFNYYIDLIDKVLEEDDLNNDGYLSYAEYVMGRRKVDETVKTLHRP